MVTLKSGLLDTVLTGGLSNLPLMPGSAPEELGGFARQDC